MATFTGTVVKRLRGDAQGPAGNVGTTLVIQSGTGSSAKVATVQYGASVASDLDGMDYGDSVSVEVAS